METLEADKFTEEEDTFLKQLKLNCKDDGREIDPEISAPIFHKLGTIYLRRSKTRSKIDRMICLIRCAVLLHAALVRTDSNTNVIKQDIKQLNQYLLESADAKVKNSDLWEKAKKVKLLVEQMRKHVHEKLCEIPKVEADDSEDKMYEQELNKIEVIEHLQNKISADYTKIMAALAKSCEEIMGNAPCKFAIIGMGSLARKEITPFSDFEHVIVLDSKFDGDYFRWYSVIFQVILIHLGETIIPSVLNHTNSKLGAWFYDDITKSGVCFDGTFPWASKYPLGRQQLTKNKDWKTELIKSVPDMLEYLNHEQSIKNGYHLSDILTKVCYVYGDQSLFEEFQFGLNDILQKQNENIKHEVLKQIINDLENFSIRSVLLKVSDEGNYHVKKDVYRVTTLFVAALGRLNNILTFSCFDIIRKLAETHVISNFAKHNLMYAVAIACEIRLRWYMVNKKQKDVINGIDANAKFLEIIGETSTFSYFQIAYALQCDISKRFDLKKGHFYSHPNLLNISIYSSFQTDKQIDKCNNAFKVNPKEQRLLDFDICLKILTTKQSTLTLKESVIATGTKKDKELHLDYRLIGQTLFDCYKFLDATEYLKRALKIKQQISNDVATDRNIAVILHEIGQSLFGMNKYSDAKGYLERALTIKQRLSSDVATDREVANTLHEIGRCLIRMNKLSDAKDYLEKALLIKQRISIDVASDETVAATLHEIGRCLIVTTKLTDAKDYLEKALKIKRQLSSDLTTDYNVAYTLNEIGRCLIQMNKFTDAKEHLDIALKIEQQISIDLSADSDVAFTSHVTGRCLIGMNKFADAKDYLGKALKIKQRISNDIATDRSVAITLHEIGRCFIKMNELTDAKDYLEKALIIRQRISSDVACDKEVVLTLNEIDRCLLEMNKRKA